MSGGEDEENILRMTKEELQRWIQAEVDRNPQLMHRHQQLAQVEEWVKQKEREGTYTRLLYSNACESVLECESVMKGLYGMLGLHYGDEDSEEEGGGGGVKEGVIHITDDDDEEGGEEKGGGGDNDDDVVVVGLAAAKETLEPMIEKVNMALQKSSRLVEDLVQRVTKVTSMSSESPSNVISRPSSVLTPETSSSGSVTPAPSSPSVNQTKLGESLELTDSTIAIIKTESLSMATTPLASPNSHFTATIKTEPQLTALSPSDNANHHQTTVSNNCYSIKTEPQTMAVTPESSSLDNSDQSETSVIQNSDTKPTIKTESQLMPATPETSVPPSSSEVLKTTSRHSLATVKTEPQFTPLATKMSSPSNAEKVDATDKSDSIATVKTEPLLTTLKAGMSLHESKTEQPETFFKHSLGSRAAINSELQLNVTPCEMSTLPRDSKQPGHNSESIATDKTDPPLTAITSDVSVLTSSSEEDQTISGHKSASTDNKASERKSPVPLTPSMTRLRSSTAASSVPNTPSLQKQTRASSTSDSSDESDDNQTHHDDPTYLPSKSSKSKTANNTSRNPNNACRNFNIGRNLNNTINPNNINSNAVTSPSLNIQQPAAHVRPSDAGQISTPSSSKSFESSETHKEIELKVNVEVLGKWKNKTWHRGTVKETQKTENGHRYKVEFRNGKQCVLPAHQVACLSPPLLRQLFIGCRLVCSCRDDKEQTWFCAAVLGELPDRKNRMRFLVFYDDGQVAYLALPDVHLVCKQMKKVWKDIENEVCRVQVKEYLTVYPNPIAVVLRAGQDTKAKRNGKFELCTVIQLDGSLIQICFKRDKQKQWLYKGSDNFEHIVMIKKRITEQKTQQPSKAAGNTVHQCNTSSTVASARRTRQPVSRVANTPSTSPQTAMSAAFQPKVVLQRLTMPLPIPLRSAKRPVPDEEEEPVSKKDQPRSTYLNHHCCPACLDGVYFHIFYRSPCGRSLCEMQEVQQYLLRTHCDFVFLEMFCMDPFVLVNRARPPSTSTSQPHLHLPDISGGREVLPVPCMNEVDQTPAPNVKYTKDRIPAPGVTINTSLDFLTGCDCTDGCQDRRKCSCHQLTIEATSLCSGGPVDVTAGYTHKRLQTTLPTGVYECNPLCRCDPRICSNRLVQHGLQLRLELFMTQHKGWGIRCKDDVAKGTFVCVFTGKVVTEDKMNEDDTVAGNEYLANLDFIEGVEKLKEGYENEAYCSDTEAESNKKTITMKTGPLWKNTLFLDDSSSGEEKDEPMQLDSEQEKMDGKIESQETSSVKRFFAVKSWQRRVKPLETSDARTGKTHAVNITRQLFNGEETCYIIDARQEGNLGRFINHSCNPNLFVQNVFVDTHDLRFPWVAFFTSKRIKAGTELTWDYNYEVGSVEGKVLLCCCGSSRCTGRLL